MLTTNKKNYMNEELGTLDDDPVESYEEEYTEDIEDTQETLGNTPKAADKSAVVPSYNSNDLRLSDSSNKDVENTVNEEINLDKRVVFKSTNTKRKSIATESDDLKREKKSKLLVNKSLLSFDDNEN